MKHLLSACLIGIMFHSFADMPGNKGRTTYNVKVSGLKNFSNYTFYVDIDNRVPDTLKEGSSILIPGGYGAPQCKWVWAVNKTGDVSTDTLYFCSGEQEKSISVVLHIDDHHLSYELIKKGNSKEDTPLVYGNNINNDSTKNTRIMYLITAISFLVLVGLVYMVWNKNRKFQKSI